MGLALCASIGGVAGISLAADRLLWALREALHGSTVQAPR